MSAWTPTVFLDPASREPLYLQIAQALMHEIHRGHLKPGDGLPGEEAPARPMGFTNYAEPVREEVALRMRQALPGAP